MNLKNLNLQLTTIALMVFLFFGCASKITLQVCSSAFWRNYYFFNPQGK